MHVLLAALQAVAPLATQPELFFPATGVPAHIVAWEAREGREQAVVAQAFVVVDIAALRTLTPSAPAGAFAVDLLGRRGVLRTTSVERVLRHHLVRGQVDGDAGQVILALGDTGAVAGDFDLAGSRFLLAYTGEQRLHSLRRIDLAQHELLSRQACAVGPEHHVDAPGDGRHGVGPASSGQTTIDLGIVYTPAARAAGGGQAALEAELMVRVGNATVGCANSGVDQRFRAVYLAETNYTEDGTNNDLSRFRATNDGFMDEVHASRTTYGADVMCLITNPASASYCGVGYLMTTLSTGFRTSAFSVTVRSCLSGHTMTHEIGHNLGCHHDRANGSGALYPYSYGYRTPDNAYRTIMAYAPGTRINYWSSPLVRYLGQVLGVADSADNARSLGNTRVTASMFYATRMLEWCTLSGGIPGVNGLPTLAGEGTIDNTAPIRITIGRMPAGNAGVLILGTQAVNLPLFGGTLVPRIDLSAPIVGTAAPLVLGAGALATLPPGTNVYVQVFFVDAAASQGVSASHGLQTRIP